MNTNVLNQLRDIHLPMSVNAWPPAPGWIVLAFLVLIIIVVAIIAAGRFWRHHKPKKSMLHYLEIIARDYEQHKNAVNTISRLSMFMRKAALIAYPKEEVASLYGHEWLSFLDNTSDTTEFTQGVGRCLAQAPYQKSSQLQCQPLFELIQRWVQKNV